MVGSYFSMKHPETNWTVRADLPTPPLPSTTTLNSRIVPIVFLLLLLLVGCYCCSKGVFRRRWVESPVTTREEAPPFCSTTTITPLYILTGSINGYWPIHRMTLQHLQQVVIALFLCVYLGSHSTVQENMNAAGLLADNNIITQTPLYIFLSPWIAPLKLGYVCTRITDKLCVVCKKSIFAHFTCSAHFCFTLLFCCCILHCTLWLIDWLILTGHTQHLTTADWRRRRTSCYC